MILVDDVDDSDEDDDVGHYDDGEEEEQGDIYFLFECLVVRLYDDVFVVMLLVSV
jgi:hypothetical protein